MRVRSSVCVGARSLDEIVASGRGRWYLTSSFQCRALTLTQIRRRRDDVQSRGGSATTLLGEARISGTYVLPFLLLKMIELDYFASLLEVHFLHNSHS